MQDIYKIFEEVAKNNKQFAKQFYKYRGLDYIPYNKDIALQNQVNSIASITAGRYSNIANTRAIGYVFENELGQRVFKNIQQTYQETIDRAILSISQGKQTFYQEMRNVLKQLGRSGLVQYESGVTRRLDSAIRMNMLDGIRQLNNENTIRFGKEYDADGIEISVHSNPAPDHADIQGRQFSNEEYQKLENGGIAKDYKGNVYNGADKRHISEYNCYHKIFTIVLGVSKPEYTDEELKKIQEDNKKGFEFEGKHYTNYEGTQLQRRIELEIRKQKDTNILAKASGDNGLAQSSELKIRQLTNKYNELCKTSGLTPQKQRMSVSGYSRIKVDNIKEKANDVYIPHFTKIRDFINNTKKYSQINEDLDIDGFYKEYNKFYNSLDKSEISKINNEYTKWNGEGEHPIGKYLNKKLKYDNKPEIIDMQEFLKDKDVNVTEFEPSLLDENHWYRGIADDENGTAKKYIEDFKYGHFYAGKGVNGNGTYVTESYTYANRFSNYKEDGMIYIMPKENSKIVDIDKIKLTSMELLKKFDKYKIKDDLYEDFTTNLFIDNGYLASILGYDIINIGEHKLILNRGSIKVVK